MCTLWGEFERNSTVYKKMMDLEDGIDNIYENVLHYVGLQKLILMPSFIFENGEPFRVNYS